MSWVAISLVLASSACSYGEPSLSEYLHRACRIIEPVHQAEAAYFQAHHRYGSNTELRVEKHIDDYDVAVFGGDRNYSIILVSVPKFISFYSDSTGVLRVARGKSATSTSSATNCRCGEVACR